MFADLALIAEVSWASLAAISDIRAVVATPRSLTLSAIASTRSLANPSSLVFKLVMFADLALIAEVSWSSLAAISDTRAVVATPRSLTLSEMLSLRSETIPSNLLFRLVISASIEVLLSISVPSAFLNENCPSLVAVRRMLSAPIDSSSVRNILAIEI